jgi:lambda family phage portal protein
MGEKLDVRPNWLDRAIGFVSPERGLRRMRARVASELVARHYEAVSTGRRTQGWHRPTGDANAVIGPALSRLRTAARDLVRNNGHAKKARNKIAEHVVGWGIVAKPQPKSQAALDVWKRWAESKECDAEGRLDFYGLQKLVMRSVVESGEVLVRQRLRLPQDGLSIPMQLQVLEPDFLDTEKNLTVRDREGRIVSRILHGVEFDALGRRVAYWLFPEHPGATDITGVGFGAGASRRIPASGILHVYLQERPGQVRGPSWFAASLLKFKDFDEYGDATLMKQKIAACLAVITSDTDGSAAALGTTDQSTSPELDLLEPGMILNVPPGREVNVVQPPSVREHGEYSRITLHEIAAGLGTTYEDLTGDYSQVNFSSARMSRLSHWDQVHEWRWNMLIPQFCDPVWSWAMEAAAIMGMASSASVRWTPPPMPMIEPDKEGLAHQRNIRNGLKTLPQVLREMGEDPDEVFAEIADTNGKLDDLEIVLDSDPRKTTQAGNPVTAPAAVSPETEPEEPEEVDDEEEDTEGDEDLEEEEAERAHRERLALIEAARASASRPLVVRLDPGAVQVDARTTVAHGAVQVSPPAVNVDARTTVSPDAFRVVEGAVQLRLTIAETVQVPAGRQRIERGPDGEITAVVAEGVPHRIAIRGARKRRQKADDDEK